ncbi:odorant receptor coreceptor-like [Neocloeon triangulifer]|uniref:odorant receptor coreceptor-like n=1 Tax=Neocloeon triangulifer TaxID=2078957 RepID=UPI00286F8662|nr:odorant receptor coreceptor-like [Neocloeon triangulifer]
MLIQEFPESLFKMEVKFLKLQNSFLSLDLKTWTSYSNLLERIHHSIDKVLAPFILAIVLHSACAACLETYMLTNTSYGSQNSYYLLSGIFFTSITLLQTYIFCETGQRLRNNAHRLGDAVFQGPWTDLSEEKLLCAQMLEARFSKTFVVHVGSFFELSMEFFGTIIGAVVTYFIVLAQMKKNN